MEQETKIRHLVETVQQKRHQLNQHQSTWSQPGALSRKLLPPSNPQQTKAARHKQRFSIMEPPRASEPHTTHVRNTKLMWQPSAAPLLLTLLNTGSEDCQASATAAHSATIRCKYNVPLCWAHRPQFKEISKEHNKAANLTTLYDASSIPVLGGRHTFGGGVGPLTSRW
jgi:hypothetical protein